MHPISAVIITFNEEDSISRCIASVQKVADEIIVLDSFSTDRTAEIARRCGAVVHQRRFMGYIAQKNAALQLATYNYILSLDADEALTDELVVSILQAKKTLEHRAYRMSRLTCYCGHFIRHGLWYPDRKIRLFDRRISTWGGLNPHDKIILESGLPAKTLKGDLLHYSFNTPEDLVWQNNRHSSIAAAALYAAGKKSSWYKMLVHPAWAFLNGYIFRGGFRDGADGFAIAIQTANQVFLKYNKLYKLQVGEKIKSVTEVKPLLPEQKNATADGGV